MKQRHISLDLDGVLCNFTRSAIEIINDTEILDISLNYQPTDWHWTDRLSGIDWTILWECIEATPNFWIKILPYEDQVRSLRNWQGMIEWAYAEPPVKVHYTTARTRTCGDDPQIQSEAWLSSQGLHGNVHWVEKPEDKLPLMRELDIQYSLDDLPSTVEQCNTIPGHKAFLLDRPWNRESTQPRVRHVRNFLMEVQRHGFSRAADGR